MLLFPLMLMTAAQAAPLPNVLHEQFAAPTSFKQGCKGLQPQAAVVEEVFYFLPTPGTSPLAFLTFNASSKTWGSLPISDQGVASMLDGASMTSVGNFLVLSGGRSKNVLSLNLQTGAWKAEKTMSNSQTHSCSVECRGYWFSMTGDMAKTSGLGSGKPANRQVYRYNLSSGEAFENNGEKERGGAGCGCDPDVNNGTGRVFWAGGFSDAGVTSNVEMWSADPLKRRGQPSFSTSEKRRDVGATVCGGLFIVAGGNDGKKSSSSVDTFYTNSTTDGSRVTLKLSAALTLPRVACLGNRFALISGGDAGATTCNTDVFMVDTAAPLVEGSALPTLSKPLGATGQVSVATDRASGRVMFFDGHRGDLFTLQNTASIVV